jgi:hypothetical protein
MRRPIGPIRVEVQTEDQNLRELCEFYWDADEYGKFTYKVAELAEIYGFGSHEIARIVRENCTAFAPDQLCEWCNAPTKYFTSRSDAQYGGRRYGHSTPELCKTCSDEWYARKKEEEERRVEQQEREEQRRREQQRLQKHAEMTAAFEGGVYEALTPLELAPIGHGLRCGRPSQR